MRAFFFVTEIIPRLNTKILDAPTLTKYPCNNRIIIGNDVSNHLKPSLYKVSFCLIIFLQGVSFRTVGRVEMEAYGLLAKHSFLCESAFFVQKRVFGQENYACVFSFCQPCKKDYPLLFLLVETDGFCPKRYFCQPMGSV